MKLNCPVNDTYQTAYPPAPDAEIASLRARLRAWRTGFFVLLSVGVVMLFSATVNLIFHVIFIPPESSEVVSFPRDCVVLESKEGPQLVLALDTIALGDAWLASAELSYPPGGVAEYRVAAYGIAPSLPPLANLSEHSLQELFSLHEGDMGQRAGDAGVLVVVVDLQGRQSGELRSMQTTWSRGEPVTSQLIPLGVHFSNGECAVPGAERFG